MASAQASEKIEAALKGVLDPARVLPGTTSAYLTDATESRGVRGHADAVCLPETAEEVAAVVAWCYDRGVPIVPRGGGTGYAGGAVPVEGGVVVALEHLAGVRAFEPELWRIHADAGVRTGSLQKLAREHGLYFPPDPGAVEQSQLGGNVATNAAGPHSFKYGATAAWVTGLEVVVPPGELITLGGPIRKDAASYRLKSLLVGSEGTLGVITAVWLRLVPAPEASLPVIACFPDAAAGCEAIETVLGSGLQVAALEYLDEGAVAAARLSFPGPPLPAPGFMLLLEADGSEGEAHRLRAETLETLSPAATAIHAPTSRREVDALWSWRAGVSFAVIAQRGGKASEDIVVPVDRLAEAIAGCAEIGRRHDLATCSWGHAGDGNLHATFLIDRHDPSELTRAATAARELFALAIELGGSISGEHGIGSVKRGQLALQLSERALSLHRGVKELFDPRGLMNPGKKA